MAVAAIRRLRSWGSHRLARVRVRERVRVRVRERASGEG